MTLTLRSAGLEVTLAPERGADILQIVDLATGIPTLSVSPTANVTTSPSLANDSASRQLTGYPGGWQLLVPNAGPERVHDGVLQGFHGEAALSSWETVSASDSEGRFTARLLTAPLELHRHVQVHNDAVVVTDTIHNQSPDAVSTRIVQHPAFGTPFLDEHSYLVTTARTLVADADAPGTLAAPDAVGAPTDLLPPGPVPSSVALPGPGSGESLFAGLTDFPHAEPSVLFASPTHGFGMRVSWQREHLPMAWLWMEANAGSGWPWFRRMYAMAVEPANVLPGEGTAVNGYARGGVGTTLAGGSEITTTVRVSRESLNP